MILRKFTIEIRKLRNVDFKKIDNRNEASRNSKISEFVLLFLSIIPETEKMTTGSFKDFLSRRLTYN